MNVAMLCCPVRKETRVCDLMLGKAASRCSGITAVCVIFLFFAAEDHKSYWNSCMKVAIRIFQ